MPGQASENYFLISDVRKPYSSYPQHCKKREKVRVPAAWSSAIQNVLGCMSRVPQVPTGRFELLSAAAPAGCRKISGSIIKSVTPAVFSNQKNVRTGAAFYAWQIKI
jgi:hypothetical protein